MRHFSTSAGGGYYAVGRGGAMTGRGADLLLLDDLIKDSCEAGSEQIRQMIYQWYTSVALTRLQPDGGIVLISTRWHEDDLSGRLLRESGDGLWHVLSLPAIAERDDSFRVAGGVLWPEKFHFRFWTKGVRKLVAPSGPRCINRGHLLPRGLPSSELGSHITASIHRSSASFKVGTRHIKPALSTIFLRARPGA